MWFALALLSAVFAGLQSFLNKVAAERGYDTYHISAASAVVAFLAAGVLFLATSSSLASIPPLVYVLGLASGIIYTGRSITQLEALKFIDAAIFFPLYKVIGPALVTVLGIFLLKDHVSALELAGIILSCLVPLLLITRAEHRRQKNLNLGLLLMLLSTSLAAGTAAVNAYAVQPDADYTIPFIVIAYAVSMVFGIALYMRRHKLRDMRAAVIGHSTRPTLLVGLATGLCQFLSFYLFLLALAGGALSIVYSINAHYIVIPVILAVLLYREHWNLQKATALVISVLALILLHP